MMTTYIPEPAPTALAAAILLLIAVPVFIVVNALVDFFKNR